MKPLAKLLWLDGRLVAWEEARLHVMTHTLHYGVGIFEGIRCYGRASGPPAIFRLREHVTRFEESARCCGMRLPFGAPALEEACRAVVRENGMRDCYLRPIAVHVDGEPGLGAVNPVAVAVIAFAWGAYLGKEGLENGIRATLSSWIRQHPGSAMLRAKISGQYVTSVLAKRLAKQSGFEEALFCDAQGYLCEGTGENLFIVKGRTLKTPPAHAAILPGITRDAVLALARSPDLGLEVREEFFARDELFVADEVFLTGTAAEITPVREIDFRPIGAGGRGPVTAELQRRFFRAVRGEEARFADWLAPIA